MNILSCTEIRQLSIEEIEEEVVNVKKILFDFRLKQSTRQNIKPHEYKMYKRQLSRILTIETEKNNT